MADPAPARSLSGSIRGKHVRRHRLRAQFRRHTYRHCRRLRDQAGGRARPCCCIRRFFLLGCALYALSAIGWFFAMRHISLAQTGVAFLDLFAAGAGRAGGLRLWRAAVAARGPRRLAGSFLDAADGAPPPEGLHKHPGPGHPPGPDPRSPGGPRAGGRRQRLPPSPQVLYPSPSKLPKKASSMADDLLSQSGPETYDASSIEVLEGLEPVRKRPGMYIGGTDERALHHLVAEILDNSMDEAVAGHATRIGVEMNADGSVTITDNGRGMPVDPHPKFPRQIGARGHPDRAACGRQVLEQGLFDLRRAERGGLLGRQRPLGSDDRAGRAQQGAVGTALFARRAAGADCDDRRGARTGAAPPSPSTPTRKSSARSS